MGDRDGLIEHGEFSVYVFFPNDTYSRELSFVSAKAAVEHAKRLTETIGARIGTTQQVMITDGEDFCVFLWRYGEGLVHPQIRGKE